MASPQFLYWVPEYSPLGDGECPHLSDHPDSALRAPGGREENLCLHDLPGDVLTYFQPLGLQKPTTPAFCC